MPGPITDTGLLRLPDLPPLLAERLRGYATSGDWLPEGLDDGLDELRERLAGYRAQVLAQLHAKDELREAFTDEDAAFADAQREAFRSGAPPSADERTSADERETMLAAVDERIQFGCEVLADVADEVKAYLREHEDELFVPLNREYSEAREMEREADALRARARDKAFTAYRAGAWLMVEVERSPFGPQPFPADLAAPEGFTVPDEQMARPWHRAVSA